MNEISTALLTNQYPAKNDLNDESNLIGAENDIQAVSQWIKTTSTNSPNTFDSYKREANRLLVYCREIGKTLAELNASDANDFLNLLRNPPENWIIPTEYHSNKNSVLLPTQLLRKGLSNSSLAQSKTILKSLFSFLNDAGYVRGNCFSLTQKVKILKSTSAENKALSLEAWNFLVDWLDQRVERENTLIQKTKAIRDRWVIHLIYHTGMRKSSVISTKMSDITPKSIGGTKYWQVNFVMKGSKKHNVILSEEALTRLREYRTYLGLSEMPNKNETDVPLVHSLNHAKQSTIKGSIINTLSGEGISSYGLNGILKDTLELAKLDCDDQFIKAELDSVTPHTFRHTCASHRLALGASLESTKETLGHSRIETTMIYTHIRDEMLVEEQNKLNKQSKSK